MGHLEMVSPVAPLQRERSLAVHARWTGLGQFLPFMAVSFQAAQKTSIATV